MKLHLFKNFKFVRTIHTPSSMCQVLGDFQRTEKTLEFQTFTVLNPADGYAFSQTYKSEGGTKVSWGTMFKHELGQINPSCPSYADLIAQVI